MTVHKRVTSKNRRKYTDRELTALALKEIKKRKAVCAKLGVKISDDEFDLERMKSEIAADQDPVDELWAAPVSREPEWRYEQYVSPKAI